MNAFLILATAAATALGAQATADPGRCIVEDQRLTRSLALRPDWTPLDEYALYAPLQTEDRRGWSLVQGDGDSTGWRERIAVARPAGKVEVRRYWAANAGDSLALTWSKEFRVEGGRVLEWKDFRAAETLAAAYELTYLADGPLAGKLSEYRADYPTGATNSAKRHLFTYRPDGTLGEALVRRILTGDPTGRREENVQRHTWTPIASGERVTEWEWGEVSGLWSAHAAVDLHFDGSDRLTSKRTWFLGRGNPLLMGRTDYRYDDRGRLVHALQYGGEAGMIDTAWASVEDRYAYDDAAGRVAENRVARERAADTAGSFHFRIERTFDSRCRVLVRKDFNLLAKPSLIAWSVSEPTLHSVSIRSRQGRAPGARGVRGSVDLLGRKSAGGFATIGSDPSARNPKCPDCFLIP